MPGSERMVAWSCGGGVQSAAIAALIVQGRLPAPEVSVIVDTGREKSGTWDYMERVIMPALQGAGVTLHRVYKERYATVDIYAKNGDILLPVFTGPPGKKEGKLPTYCSNEWKQRVARRWLREQSIKECDLWLGISTDEARRMRFSGLGWLRHRYPLIEDEFGLSFSRSDCLRVVEEAGWPPPPRSSCWMCPNMGDAEWREMKAEYPDDFAQAVHLERQIRERDPGVWLHDSCVPLDQAEFSDQDGTRVDRACASGMCFV